MKLGILGSFCLSAIVASSASADDWARKMIDTKKVDFNVIAAGSEAVKFVEVKNIYNQSVHISSVSTTCGCSAATPGKTTLKPGETGSVEVKMNTQKFRRKKDSNLIIRFDLPRFAEVRIPIHAYIRSDVVFDPGMIRFGNVDVGAGKTSNVEIRYAGRTDWEIVDVKEDNSVLSWKLSAPKGDRASGRVNYQLTVQLDPAARAGRIRDVITLVTNDKVNPFVPLMVEGNVVPDITVTPSLVNFSRIQPGTIVPKKLIVRGKKKFSIESVGCEGMADCFEARVPEGERKLHTIPIQFSAPENAGRFEDELLIRIAGRTQPLRLRVQGIVN